MGSFLYSHFAYPDYLFTPERRTPQIKTLPRIWVFFLLLKLIVAVDSYVLSLFHNFISVSLFVERRYWYQEAEMLAWATVQYWINNIAWKRSKIFWFIVTCSLPKAILYMEYSLNRDEQLNTCLRSDLHTSHFLTTKFR